VKNPNYSQAENRHELFEKRRKQEPRWGRWRRPELVLVRASLHAHGYVVWERTPQRKVLLAAFLDSRW
jgi:hypothetical protein